MERTSNEELHARAVAALEAAVAREEAGRGGPEGEEEPSEEEVPRLTREEELTQALDDASSLAAAATRRAEAATRRAEAAEAEVARLRRQVEGWEDLQSDLRHARKGLSSATAAFNEAHSACASYRARLAGLTQVVNLQADLLDLGLKDERRDRARMDGLRREQAALAEAHNRLVGRLRDPRVRCDPTLPEVHVPCAPRM